MKAIYFTTVLITCLIAAMKVDHQCDPEKEAKICLEETPSGFNFLKSYPVAYNSSNKVEFSYVLTKGTNYVIALCDQGTKSMTVLVANSNRVKVAESSFHGDPQSKIIFQCNATGIYYITYSFVKAQASSCGGSVLAFKRN